MQQQQQQQQAVQPPPSALPLESCPHQGSLPPASPPSDPLVRKQVVQDLMEQMQGTYNFMQVGGRSKVTPPERTG